MSRHPADTGGTTKYGISLRFLKSVVLDRIDVDLDDDNDVDENDIVLLPEDLARRLYKMYFWDPIAAGNLISQPLATKLLDASVLSGPKRGLRWLNQANFELSGVDGLAGEAPSAGLVVETSNRLLRADPGNEQRLLERFREQQLSFYRRIVERNPSQGVFLKGWTRRALSC